MNNTMSKEQKKMAADHGLLNANKGIRELLVKHDAATDVVKRDIQIMVPIGARIRWCTTRSGERYEQFGRVVRYHYDPHTVVAKNDRTGKESNVALWDEHFVLLERP